jgi:hypothetical protein
VTLRATYPRLARQIDRPVGFFASIGDHTVFYAKALGAAPFAAMLRLFRHRRTVGCRRLGDPAHLTGDQRLQRQLQPYRADSYSITSRIAAADVIALSSLPSS